MTQVLISLIILAIGTTVIVVPGWRERLPGGPRSANVVVNVAIIGFIVTVLGYIWFFPTGSEPARILSSIPLGLLLAWCVTDLVRDHASL